MRAVLSALLGCALLMPALGQQVTVFETTTFTYEAIAGHTTYTPDGTEKRKAHTTTLHIPLTTTTTFKQALYSLDPTVTYVSPSPPPPTTTVTIFDYAYTTTDYPQSTLTLPTEVTRYAPGTKTVTEFAATSTVFTTTATYPFGPRV